MQYDEETKRETPGGMGAWRWLYGALNDIPRKLWRRVSHASGGLLGHHAGLRCHTSCYSWFAQDGSVRALTTCMSGVVAETDSELATPITVWLPMCRRCNPTISSLNRPPQLTLTRSKIGPSSPRCSQLAVESCTTKQQHTSILGVGSWSAH